MKWNETELTDYEIEQVHIAAGILIKNLKNRIRIPELAKKVGLTEMKLKAGFSQEFGMGVYAYHLNARMEKAKEMLLVHATNRAIAMVIGYNGESNFVKAFGKKFKETPAAWRKKQRKKGSKGLHV